MNGFHRHLMPLPVFAGIPEKINNIPVMEIDEECRLLLLLMLLLVFLGMFACIK